MGWKHLSTYETEMKSIMGATVLPVMNCVVLYGEIWHPMNQGFQFYLFKIEGNDFKRVTNFKSLCDHYVEFRLIPLNVSGQEHLAVTCLYCEQIDLYPIATKTGSIAFKNDRDPFAMCAGAENKIHVHFASLKQAFELDCSKPSFRAPTKTFDSGIAACSAMCYIPPPHKAVAVSDRIPGIIKAFSLDTNELIWHFDHMIDSADTDPYSLLYSAQHDALLVADGGRKRILVLDPRDGAHLQTISLPELGIIKDLWFYDNYHKVVVFHKPGFKEIISCFSFTSNANKVSLAMNK